MRTSETINELATALAAAQGEMSNALLNKVNPHFRNRYADLAAVREATIPVLSKHKLALVQFTGFDGDGTFMLTTRLLHSSGQWLESTYPLPMAPDKPQIMGSAQTYARRYSWAGICGIASEEDDDANATQDSKPVGNGVRKSSAAAKRDGDWGRLLHEMTDAQSAVSLQRLWDSYRDTEYKTWNQDWRREADELFAKRLAEFSSGDDLKQTLADSAELAPTETQVFLYRERVKWLKSAKTPDDLKDRNKNLDHLAEVAKLTDAQREDLRNYYLDAKVALQATLLQAG